MQSFIYDDLDSTELCTSDDLLLGYAGPDLCARVEWECGKLVLAEIFMRSYRRPRGLISLETDDRGDLERAICAALRRYYATPDGQRDLFVAWGEAVEEEAA